MKKSFLVFWTMVMPASPNIFAVEYTMIDLGVLPAGFGGSTGAGYSMNFSGQVAGGYSDGSGSAAIATTSGGLTLLGKNGGDWSTGTAINASGQVTGYYGLNNSHQAFFWDGSNMNDIGTLGGDTVGMDISDSGYITGESYTSSGERHAFLWNGSILILNENA